MLYPILIRSLVAAALALICAANITRKCSGTDLFSPSVLFATCQNDRGEKIPTNIDLNTCIGFDVSKDTLRCGHGYTASCNTCYLNLNDHNICCQCGPKEYCLGYNQCVASDKDGDLVCIPPTSS